MYPAHAVCRPLCRNTRKQRHTVCAGYFSGCERLGRDRERLLMRNRYRSRTVEMPAILSEANIANRGSFARTPYEQS